MSDPTEQQEISEQQQPLLAASSLVAPDSPFQSPIFRHSLALLSGLSRAATPPLPLLDDHTSASIRRRRRQSGSSNVPQHVRRYSFDGKAKRSGSEGEDDRRSHSVRSPSQSPEFGKDLRVGIISDNESSTAHVDRSSSSSPAAKFVSLFRKKTPSPPLDARNLNGELDYEPVLNSESFVVGDEYDLNADTHVVMKKGSSFVQTVFNTTNVIVGIGILGFPFAFKNAGWIGGTFLICFIMAATCYTAQLLGRCLGLRYPKLQSFSDIGREAFGIKMEYFIGFIFFVELFLACSAYIVLCGDNLEKLFPDKLTKEQWMIFVTAVILPSTWLTDLAMLSYLSVFGIFASTFLLVVVAVTGLQTPSAPGSLLHPAPTVSFQLNSAPIALGLIMSGFAGHAVLPNIYHSMNKKEEYFSMVNWAYSIAFFLYVSMSVIGYMMFGDGVLQEITLNLQPGILCHAAVMMTIVNPITKYALTLNPIAINVESTILMCQRRYTDECSSFNKILIRTAMTGLTLLTALYLPFFDRLMEFIGSFCSFTVSLIFPCLCILKLCWNDISLAEKIVNIVLAGLGFCFAILGSYVAIAGPLKL
eukprot:TRINITY_DN1184_c0_g1_i1.p1 TRINITY_DN1184_c0_g1~~TRINITY_DN1184_c0_g1_i1.p1  ORF type:complete len:588 (-),score=146.50 TRINITY_DN1184_c0_g1_i1:457-2220(-)